MNFIENLKEGLRAIKGNMLRTILTASIIAIGIMALVGILTAVDAIKASVTNNLSSLGANNFDIESTQPWRRARRGLEEKTYPAIRYEEAVYFKERFDSYSAVTSISSRISGNAELKYRSKKTNPNTTIIGADEGYLHIKSYNITKGRNFSFTELDKGANVTILGDEIAGTLFGKEDPLGKYINASGKHYKVVGILDKSGSLMGGGGADRIIILPLVTARTLVSNRSVTYDITSSVKSPTDMEDAIAEATGLMRQIRHDTPGKEDSFKITKSDSMASSLDNIAGYLRIGGFLVGFITLLGASIGLMNIMMVSVTERTREIGVRKALGATPSRIRQQFLAEAIVICQLGGLAGVVLGILFGNGVAKLLNSDTFIVPWGWTIFGLATCVIVGLISGYYPAYKASKLDPIEALRFE